MEVGKGKKNPDGYDWLICQLSSITLEYILPQCVSVNIIFYEIVSCELLNITFFSSTIGFYSLKLESSTKRQTVHLWLSMISNGCALFIFIFEKRW